MVTTATIEDSPINASFRYRARTRLMRRVRIDSITVGETAMGGPCLIQTVIIRRRPAGHRSERERVFPSRFSWTVLLLFVSHGEYVFRETIRRRSCCVLGTYPPTFRTDGRPRGVPRVAYERVVFVFVLRLLPSRNVHRDDIMILRARAYPRPSPSYNKQVRLLSGDIWLYIRTVTSLSISLSPRFRPADTVRARVVKRVREL